MEVTEDPEKSCFPGVVKGGISRDGLRANEK